MKNQQVLDLDVLVLAGDRTITDPVAAHAGVPCKAAVRAGGTPLLVRVLSTVGAVAGVARILVGGPQAEVLSRCPELHAALRVPRVAHMEPGASPSRTAAAGLAALGPCRPVLLTTADHALLTPALVRTFLDAGRGAGADVSVGLVPFERVQGAFPGVRRTVLRFRGAAYCTCNLFAIWTPAGAAVVDYWVRVEQQRKHPVRLVAGVLGIRGLLGYVLGLLTLESALSRASRRLGARIAPVLLENAEASIDVDTPEDLRRVEEILARRTTTPGDAG